MSFASLFFQVSAGCGIVVFLAVLIWHLINQQTPHIDDLIRRALAASAIPTAILLVLYPFWPGLLAQIGGTKVYVAIAGLVFLFFAVKTITNHPHP
jgi:hypothetical protein